MFKTTWGLLFCLIPLSAIAANELKILRNCASDDEETYKIVLIAGPNDHCNDNSKPCHKYIQDMQIIRDCLKQSASGIKIDVQLYVGERPPVGSLDDVDAVVIHSSADRTGHEWHALFPQNLRPDDYDHPEYIKFQRYFDQQMNRGMGLMVLHYSIWVDHPEARQRILNWIGGYYLSGTSKVDGDPATPGTTAVETVELASPDHPVLNGVNPWTSVAEYYYRIYFGAGQSKVIPILRSPLPVNDPTPETIAWALERADGGRGFGFTGSHNHENMYLRDFRKFILNAILWVAKAKVPENGFNSVVNRRYFK